MLSTALFGWIATLSMAAKAALALTAAGVLAVGGAAVDLPEAVSDAFDRQDEVVDERPDDPGDGLVGTPSEDVATEEEAAGPRAPQVERRPELNPAPEASAEGRERATDRTGDTPARVPGTAGPGTADDQRRDGGRPTTAPAPAQDRAAPSGPDARRPATPPAAPAAPPDERAPEGAGAGAPGPAPAGPQEPAPAGDRKAPAPKPPPAQENPPPPADPPADDGATAPGAQEQTRPAEPPAGQPDPGRP